MPLASCTTCGQPHERCNGHRWVDEGGEDRVPTPCGRWPRKGTTVCPSHGGSAPAVVAKAAVVTELGRWGIEQQPDVDPGITLLRLLAQSSWRCERYAQEIAKAIADSDEDNPLHVTMIGDQLVMEPQTGKLHKVSEYVRGLPQLELREREFLAKLCKLALDAGIAERQVRMIERQGAVIEQVLTHAFRRIALTEAQRADVVPAIAEALSLVA